MVKGENKLNKEEAHSGTFMDQHRFFFLHCWINNKTDELNILLSGCFPEDVKDAETSAGGAVGVCPH